MNPDTLLKPDAFSSFARLKIRGKTWALYWVNFVLFLLLKTLIRPWVRENSVPDFIHTIIYSFPNYVEAYLGTFTIATFFLICKIKDYSYFRSLGNHAIYLLSISLAAIYVITQEMNVHTLGGNNVYDFNDIIASIIGLAVIYIMLTVFGTGIQSNQ